jgi:hypothetical protein
MEGMAIATMCELCSLQLFLNDLTNNGLAAILNNCTHLALPETSTLPSANDFAEHKKSGTRQRYCLPSAALGKDEHMVNLSFAECRALGKEKHSANNIFAESRALGKGLHSSNGRQDITVVDAVTLCRVSGPRHSAKIYFAECLS